MIADQSTQTNTCYGNPLRKLIARPKFSRVLTEARTIPSPSFLSRLFNRQDGDQNQFTCTQRWESQSSIAAGEQSFMQSSDWTWNYSNSIQNQETRAEKLIVGFIVMLIVCLTLPFSIFILCTVSIYRIKAKIASHEMELAVFVSLRLGLELGEPQMS